jgi:hypothetical protein
MSIHERKPPITYAQIIFFVLTISILSLFTCFYFNFLTGDKWASIISGLLTGLIVMLFQAFLDRYEFKTIDKYRNLGVVDILPNRKNQQYYGNLISKSNREIKVQGVTALSFLEDFANKNQNTKEDQLIEAIKKRKVKIKILVAHESYLDERHRRKAIESESRLKELSKQDNFEFRYYKHKPAHSILIIDNECLAGPVFPEVKSQDTPTIHLNRYSQLAKYYEDYFDNEWNDAEIQS